MPTANDLPAPGWSSAPHGVEFALVRLEAANRHPQRCKRGDFSATTAARGREEGDRPAQPSPTLLVTNHRPRGQDLASWAPLAAGYQDQGISWASALRSRDWAPLLQCWEARARQRTFGHQARCQSSQTLRGAPPALRMDHGPSLLFARTGTPNPQFSCHLCSKCLRTGGLEKPQTSLAPVYIKYQ